MALEVITQKDVDAKYLNQFFTDIKLHPRKLPDTTAASADKESFQEAPYSKRIGSLLKKAIKKGEKEYERIIKNK